ncbi:hypothetical protein LguiA_005719 [Lonicera macranthoides]
MIIDGRNIISSCGSILIEHVATLLKCENRARRLGLQGYMSNGVRGNVGAIFTLYSRLQVLELNLQSFFTELKPTAYNHYVVVVYDGMRGCHQPCGRHKTSINFIKYIPTALNVPEYVKKQIQSL